MSLVQVRYRLFKKWLYVRLWVGLNSLITVRTANARMAPPIPNLIAENTAPIEADVWLCRWVTVVWPKLFVVTLVAGVAGAMNNPAIKNTTKHIKIGDFIHLFIAQDPSSWHAIRISATSTCIPLLIHIETTFTAEPSRNMEYDITHLGSFWGAFLFGIGYLLSS